MKKKLKLKLRNFQGLMCKDYFLSRSDLPICQSPCSVQNYKINPSIGFRNVALFHRHLFTCLSACFTRVPFPHPTCNKPQSKASVRAFRRYTGPFGFFCQPSLTRKNGRFFGRFADFALPQFPRGCSGSGKLESDPNVIPLGSCRGKCSALRTEVFFGEKIRDLRKIYIKTTNK